MAEQVSMWRSLNGVTYDSEEEAVIADKEQRIFNRLADSHVDSENYRVIARFIVENFDGIREDMEAL